MLVGKRKFIAFLIALFTGVAAFVAYLILKGDIAGLGAFYALVGTCLKFYNDANIKEHENGG